MSPTTRHPFLLFPALSAKDQEEFSAILVKFIAAICAGIPVFVLRCVWMCVLGMCVAVPLLCRCVRAPPSPALAGQAEPGRSRSSSALLLHFLPAGTTTSPSW